MRPRGRGSDSGRASRASCPGAGPASSRRSARGAVRSDIPQAAIVSAALSCGSSRAAESTTHGVGIDPRRPKAHHSRSWTSWQVNVILKADQAGGAAEEVLDPGAARRSVRLRACRPADG